ncbi:MAG: hypothetical protein FWD57_10125, partial [Polyangiaceae bacterium]|nr:hypothetical protein [Polyangiaceae bacterium]
MNRRMKIVGVALGLLLGLAGGCAKERDPINRVQPNVYAKSFFVGEDLHDSADDPEFFMRTYVVNSSYEQPTFWYGTGSGLDRVRFEITENMLLVRKAFQYSRGRDEKGVPGGDPNGTVVAAYRIINHFDISTEYNPITGENTNVTYENMADLPWYERKYMHVDWSSNIVANPVFIEEMLAHWWEGYRYTALRYDVTDPHSEDAPFVDEEDGYLEITNRVFVDPGDINSPWGPIPACAYYALLGRGDPNTTYDCNAQAATLRSTYLRISIDHDYEAFVNTHAPEDVINNFGSATGFGALSFAAPVQDYDPAYGNTDPGYHILMHRINIWEKSHVNRACTEDWQCVQASNDLGFAHAGTRCDTFIHWTPQEIRREIAAEKAGGAGDDRLQLVKD